MKIVLANLLFVLISFYGFTSCIAPHKKGPTADERHNASLYDTLVKIEAVKKVEEINQRIIQSRKSFKFSFPLYSPEDSVEYWLVDDRVVRISVIMFAGQTMIWPTYFLDEEGRFLHVRTRILSKEPPQHWVRENMSYFHNGQPGYCEERKTNLAVDEAPGVLHLQTHSPCNRPSEEIKAEYAQYWDRVKEQIDIHRAGMMQKE